MNKFVFKIVALVGFLMILFGYIANAWTLKMKMPGSNEFEITSKIYQNFNLTEFGKNFSEFSDFFAKFIRYFAYALTAFAGLITILAFIDFSIPTEKKKILNGFILAFGVIVSICVITMFVFAILFIKKNSIVQTNGYTLTPIMENGFYFMIMGGFINGLFGIYLSTSK
ncbi:MAG: hypothetical protein ACI35W_03050 [Anaeroplasmataceae bacterium]